MPEQSELRSTSSVFGHRHPKPWISTARGPLAGKLSHDGFARNQIGAGRTGVAGSDRVRCSATGRLRRRRKECRDCGQDAGHHPTRRCTRPSSTLLHGPAYRIGGRGSSRQQALERNGCYGVEILKHPHFLPYLHYFVLGPDLPDAISSAFRARFEACGGVTSSDIVPLGREAKALTREYALKPYDAREVFYKLALDCGRSSSVATSIRDAVKSIR